MTARKRPRVFVLQQNKAAQWSVRIAAAEIRLRLAGAIGLPAILTPRGPIPWWATRKKERNSKKVSEFTLQIKQELKNTPKLAFYVYFIW